MTIRLNYVLMNISVRNKPLTYTEWLSSFSACVKRSFIQLKSSFCRVTRDQDLWISDCASCVKWLKHKVGYLFQLVYFAYVQLSFILSLENCVQHPSHSPPKSCGGQSSCWGEERNYVCGTPHCNSSQSSASHIVYSISFSKTLQLRYQTLNRLHREIIDIGIHSWLSASFPTKILHKTLDTQRLKVCLKYSSQ